MATEHASLCIVMPALNEADGIRLALTEATSTLAELLDEGTIADFEVIVIDDGSTDDTAAIVDGVVHDHECIRLLRHGSNRGVGAALRSAVGATAAEFVLSTDADMPVDLYEIRRALPLLDLPGVDVIAGRRSHFDAESSFRTAASRAYDQLIRWTLGVREQDVNFPFKLLRRSTALELALTSDGALIDAELLARARRMGFGIEQIDMEYRSRRYGDSKTMSLRVLRRLAVELLRSRRTVLR